AAFRLSASPPAGPPIAASPCGRQGRPGRRRAASSPPAPRPPLAAGANRAGAALRRPDAAPAWRLLLQRKCRAFAETRGACQPSERVADRKMEPETLDRLAIGDIDVDRSD